jgi:hypothetical protein
MSLLKKFKSLKLIKKKNKSKSFSMNLIIKLLIKHLVDLSLRIHFSR